MTAYAILRTPSGPVRFRVNAEARDDEPVLEREDNVTTDETKPDEHDDGKDFLRWLTENGKQWDNVPCVLCELGRTCPEHPENDPDAPNEKGP